VAARIVSRAVPASGVPAGPAAPVIADTPEPACSSRTAPHWAGLDPTLLVAANTSGGVVGKMISLAKLGLTSRLQIVVWAYEHGLNPPMR
jgi:L-lactate permease